MKRYIFVGNRFYVLEKMLENKLNIVKIYVPAGSFVEIELKKRQMTYTVLPEKREFIENLLTDDYDVLISNGCPYILPISKLKENNSSKKFINIHPSLLPDLKGKSPINGAVLFGRKHGVTCHYMDDTIDGGDVIAQIEIPMSDDLSLGLLYQISFISEGLVFEKAFKNKFHKIENHLFTGKEIYYSRKKEDCYLEKEDSMETIIRKIKAFSIYGQYAKVRCKEGEYDIFNINKIENKYINKLFEKEKDNTIILKYDNDKFLIKYLGVLIEISISKPYLLQVGQVWIESI